MITAATVVGNLKRLRKNKNNKGSGEGFNPSAYDTVHIYTYINIKS